MSVAVIGVQVQHLLSSLAEPISQESPADQSGSNGWGFTFSDIACYRIAEPDIDKHIKIEPNKAHDGGQVSDAPTPQQIRS